MQVTAVGHHIRLATDSMDEEGRHNVVWTRPSGKAVQTNRTGQQSEPSPIRVCCIMYVPKIPFRVQGDTVSYKLTRTTTHTYYEVY